MESELTKFSWKINYSKFIFWKKEISRKIQNKHTFRQASIKKDGDSNKKP